MAEVKVDDVKYFDPQSGKQDVSDYISRMRPGMVAVTRIDDKLINPKIKNLFKKK